MYLRNRTGSTVLSHLELTYDVFVKQDRKFCSESCRADSCGNETLEETSSTGTRSTDWAAQNPSNSSMSLRTQHNVMKQYSHITFMSPKHIVQYNKCCHYCEWKM